MIAHLEIETPSSSVRIKESSLQDDVDTERRIAIRDLLAENVFQPQGKESSGPWSLQLSLASPVLSVSYAPVSAESDKQSVDIRLEPIQRLIKDYFAICESYFAALRDDPMGLETIDMARRGLHNEAAEHLSQLLLEAGLEIDSNTARRLFTIVCTMYVAN